MLAPGDNVGGYKILAKIGEGGMGEVYLGEHRRIARKAAVKVLHPEHSRRPDIVERFFAEAKAASLIRHDNIVEVLDCDVLPDGAAYIVMEFLEGESLEACLARVGKLEGDLDAAIWILEQVANALTAAHAKGIVHRDLKPANVYLTSDPDSGRRGVKVLDFGIAKLAAGGAASHTQTGSLLGTPLYMSPEQCRGAMTLDHRSDVYSLGCLAFELLAGRPPFVRELPGDLLVAHISEVAPALGAHAPKVPPQLEGLIGRMLAKSPDERPQTMAKVAAELGAILGSIKRESATIHLPALAAPMASLPASSSSPSAPPRTPPPKAPSAAGRAPSGAAMEPGWKRSGSTPQTTFSNTAAEQHALVPKRPLGRRWLYGAVGAGLLVVGLVAVRLSGGKGQPPPPPPAPAAEKSVTAAVPTLRNDAPAVPALVEIEITSDPTGADVRLGGDEARAGVTPFIAKLPRSTTPLLVRLAREGYEVKTISVTPAANRTLEVTLVKAQTSRKKLGRRRASRDDGSSEFLKLED